MSQQPPVQKSALDELYQDFVADAVERFPYLKGRLIIVDARTGKNYHDVDPKKSLAERSVPRYLRRKNEVQKRIRNPRASSFSWLDTDRFFRQKVVALIVVNQPEIDRAESVSEQTRRSLLYVLDHELGHLGVKDGYSAGLFPGLGDSLRDESVADAYALIRHYQRFGAESDDEPFISAARRARNLAVYGDKGHFTSFVMEEISRRRHEIDFSALTPAETCDLAHDIALEYMPTEALVKKLEHEFSGVKEAFNRNAEAGLEALIDKTLDPATDDTTFKTGALWLGQYLDTRQYMNGEPIPLPKTQLDDAARRLKQRMNQKNSL